MPTLGVGSSTLVLINNGFLRRFRRVVMERRAMKLLTLAAALLFAVLPTFADSFNVFVLEITPHGQVDIQLTPNGNPLVLSFAPKPTSHFELEFFVPSFVPT